MSYQLRAFRIFCAGQFLFYSGLVLCVFIEPKGLIDDSGISYYGGHLSTLLPFVIALGGSALCGILTAHRIETMNHDYRIGYGLVLCAFLICCIIATPFNWGYRVYLWHTSFGSMLFAFQLLIAGWLSFGRNKDWQLMTLWVGQLLAIGVSLYYIIVPHGYLLLSQLAFQLCFSMILLKVLYTLSGRTTPMRVFRAKRPARLRRLLRSE